MHTRLEPDPNQPQRAQIIFRKRLCSLIPQCSACIRACSTCSYTFRMIPNERVRPPPSFFSLQVTGSCVWARKQSYQCSHLFCFVVVCITLQYSKRQNFQSLTSTISKCLPEHFLEHSSLRSHICCVYTTK